MRGQVLLRKQRSWGGSRGTTRAHRRPRTGHRQAGQLSVPTVPMGSMQEVGYRVEGSQRGVGERERRFAVAEADDWDVRRKRRG